MMLPNADRYACMQYTLHSFATSPRYEFISHGNECAYVCSTCTHNRGHIFYHCNRACVVGVSEWLSESVCCVSLKKGDDDDDVDQSWSPFIVRTMRRTNWETGETGIFGPFRHTQNYASTTDKWRTRTWSSETESNSILLQTAFFFLFACINTARCDERIYLVGRSGPKRVELDERVEGEIFWNNLRMRVQMHGDIARCTSDNVPNRTGDHESLAAEILCVSKQLLLLFGLSVSYDYACMLLLIFHSFAICYATLSMPSWDLKRVLLLRWLQLPTTNHSTVFFSSTSLFFPRQYLIFMFWTGIFQLTVCCAFYIYFVFFIIIFILSFELHCCCVHRAMWKIMKIMPSNVPEVSFHSTNTTMINNQIPDSNLMPSVGVNRAIWQMMVIRQDYQIRLMNSWRYWEQENTMTYSIRVKKQAEYG